MIKRFPLLLLLLFLSLKSFAQMPYGGGGNGAGNVGHFYGKVIDSTTGKPVSYAIVELTANRWDTASKSMKPKVIAGMVCGDNGEFSLEHLPVMGKMTLKISFLGYQDYIKPVSFHIDFTKIKKTPAGTPDYSIWWMWIWEIFQLSLHLHSCNKL
jgi:hypothetical protein